MKLRPAAEPGVWRTDDFDPAAPGTYAFIVGVSSYPHLDGTFGKLGLDPLSVSALTAYRFFRYIADTYVYVDCPITEIRLLLSPTQNETIVFESERDIDCEALANTPRATLANLETAEKAFHRRLQALSPETAARSRAFFFFSGHGIQLNIDHQLLLPEDYLGDDRVGGAVSTMNLWRGLSSVSVPDVFLLLDACRSDIAPARGFANVQGQQTLDVPQVARTTPVIMYASNPGESTWQPPKATSRETISYFGQAVLDALLQRDPEFKPDCKTKPCRIRFMPLMAHVGDSMAGLLASVNVISDLPVAGSNVRNSVVSHVLDPGGRAIRGLPGGAPPGPDLRHARAALSDVKKAVRGLRAAARAARLPKGAQALAQAAVYEWKESEWVKVERSLTILARDRAADGRRWRLHFALPNPKMWAWIQTEGLGLDFGFLAPRTIEHPTTLAFDILVSDSEELLEARLGLSTRHNLPVLRDAQMAYDRYRTQSADAALDLFGRHRREGASDLETVLSILEAKGESPLAATILGLILLRSTRHKLAERYALNLARRYAYSSDASVFAIQRALDAGEEIGAAFILEQFESIERNGVPITTEGFVYFVRMLGDMYGEGAIYTERLRPFADIVPRGATTGPATTRIELLSRKMRSTGLFVGFATSPDELALIRQAAP